MTIHIASYSSNTSCEIQPFLSLCYLLYNVMLQVLMQSSYILAYLLTNSLPTCMNYIIIIRVIANGGGKAKSGLV